MYERSEIDIRLLREHHFTSLSKRKKEFLNTYYEEMSIPIAIEKSGVSKNVAYNLVNSDIGKKYLAWRDAQSPFQGRTKRDDLVKELEKMAFSSMDDFVQIWEDYIDTDETDEDGIAIKKNVKRAKFSLDTIAEMPKRQRREIMASLGKIKADRWGNIQEISSNKLKAIELLSKIIGAFEEDDSNNRVNRSGKDFIDAIKKLRGVNNG